MRKDLFTDRDHNGIMWIYPKGKSTMMADTEGAIYDVKLYEDGNYAATETRIIDGETRRMWLCTYKSYHTTMDFVKKRASEMLHYTRRYRYGDLPEVTPAPPEKPKTAKELQTTLF